MIDHWLKKLQLALFPSHCLLCGAPGQDTRDLCAGCAAELPRNPIACPRCALPLPHPGLPCGRCQRRPPPFERTIAPLRYRHPVDALIRDFKFHGRLTLAPLLAELLAEAVTAAAVPRPEALLPVPLHPARLRERGFNQSLELTRHLGRRLALPLLLDGVQRVRPTLAQSSGLGLLARRRNLRGAFVVTKPLAVRHLAIIDDVYTSGSTVSELARTLRRAGVATLQVWVCARTPPAGDL
ncbi:MAG TPA: ComF family protein [Candidatus Competibacteraceae bacterium]|nr:ComF family protein [Candidatus Competibacteraceae bacterium]